MTAAIYDRKSSSRSPRMLLALLCLLTLATSASGECAWVLWSQLYAPSAGDWVMQTTYSTATECTEAIDYREVLTPTNGFTASRR